MKIHHHYNQDQRSMLLQNFIKMASNQNRLSGLIFEKFPPLIFLPGRVSGGEPLGALENPSGSNFLHGSKSHYSYPHSDIADMMILLT